MSETVDDTRYDTPLSRATINQFQVDELDELLSDIRERRLDRVRKLEALARVRADEAQLAVYLKFERAYERAKRAVAKLTEQEQKVDAVVHKARLLAMQCGG